MQKAQSRLRAVDVIDTSPSITASQIRNNSSQQSNLIPLYVKHLPTLFLAIISSASLWYILTQIHPHSIKNFLLPQSYLPLILSFWLTTFWATSFLLLNSKRGFFVSLALSMLLFFHLQKVILDWWLIGIVGAVCVFGYLGWELLLILFYRK